ncbi:MAG: 6-carboxytetrahydropterin synthase [Thermodesulfobacteriota bacterium]
MKFTVAVKRRFIARHYLIGGDWGDENDVHSHEYGVEVSLEGTQLNEHGYVADIAEIGARVDGIIAGVKEKTLNDLDEFSGLNPSVERLAALFCRSLLTKIAPGISAVRVRVFEDDGAWAACRREIP